MSWLSSLFRPRKQEAPRIIGPTETPEGALYKKRLEDILAGRETGYSPSVLSSATAPFAQARRENLTRYELPAISAQASARGLGRSTIPINRAALSTQEAERDIESRIAEVILANEEQKRAEVSDALTKYGALTGDIASAENLKSGAATSALNLNRAAGNKFASDFFNKAGKVAAGAVVGGMTGGPFGAVAGGVSALASQDTDTLTTILSKLRNPALVQTSGRAGGGAYDPSQFGGWMRR